jgi:hypothetical protein
MKHRFTATLAALVALAWAAPAAAQYHPSKPRRQFVTVSYDWIYTQSLKFADHPLADLTGQKVKDAQFTDHDYVTADGSVLIDVTEFSRRGNGLGVTVYPLGLSVGPTLALRGSIQEMPNIRIDFSGPGAPPDYAFLNGRALDAAALLYISDRSAGWGLGSNAFVGGGLGRIQSDLANGSRYFAEAGGGINSGPLGVEISVKFAWNSLPVPVDHHFMTVPVTIRGTVSF